MGLVNETPYEAGEYHHLDSEGFDSITFVVKATFDVASGGVVSLADEQCPLRGSDEFVDTSRDWSSVHRPADLGPPKIGADVVVLGSAYLPARANYVDLLVRVGSHSAPLRVHGPRLFEMGIGGVVIGKAFHVREVPLVYEKAYGGCVLSEGLIDERNPCGVGIASSYGDLEGRPAPQIEHPERAHRRGKDCYAPMGYASIPPNWSPRKEYFGTVDLVWRKTRMPLEPKDFDLRYNNAAHPSLQLEKSILPGDSVAVMGMTPTAPLVFAVPMVRPVFRARYDNGWRERTPALDTLVIYPDQSKFELLVRATFRIGRKNRLRTVQIASS